MPKKGSESTKEEESETKKEGKSKSSSVATPIAPIANPLAGRKLTKKVLKLVKKASKEKAVKRGVKEVVKAIRKGEKGLCVIAGDISPIDVITHVPVYCEDNNILYVYVPSKEALGTASQTKRPTSCVLVGPKADSELQGSFKEINQLVKEITPSV